MRIPDLLVVVVALLLALWRLLAPAWQPRRRLVAVGLGIVLALGQWVRCDFTWQLVPAYLVLGLSLWPHRQVGAAARTCGRIIMSGMAALTILTWMLPAVPALPEPTGRHAVGTAVFRWTDSTRGEPNTADTTDRRSVIVQAWYPTGVGASSRNAAGITYLDAADRLPRQISGVPRFVLHRSRQIDIHATPDALLAPHDRAWPVVIFLPGYGAPRAVYTGLLTQLASRGVVVLAVDHPYESAHTQLPDGRVVGTQERLLPGERNRVGYMTRQQAVRVADVQFVLDRLSRDGALPFPGGGLHPTRVAVIGHSFGGAAAAALLSVEPRVAAAVNLDGTPYGDLPERVLARPFLLVQSDSAETHHGPPFVNGNARLFARMTAPGYRYAIRHANHYSFTDLPYFLAPPARWAVAQLVGGARGAAGTQQVTVELVMAFLAGPLLGTRGDVAATAAQFSGVTGGRVH